MSPRFELANEDRHNWIMAQLIVVVEVLVPKGNSEHPLTYQRHDLMLNPLLAPRIVKAGSKPIHHPDRTIRRSQQQRSPLRTDGPGVKSRDYVASFYTFKSKEIWATLCGHRGAPRIGDKWLVHNNFR